MSETNNALIFGKDPQEHIVSIEAADNGYWIITESPETGEVSYDFRDGSYWLLTNKQISSKQKRLEGNQFYRYMAELPTVDTFMLLKSKLRKKNIDFYTANNLKENIMLRNGITYFKGFKSPEQVSILFFDIETTGLVKDGTSKVLLISNTYRRGSKVIKKLFAYDEYETEAEFLSAWCEWVRKVDPSIMCGHNIFGYDLPYLQHCAQMAGTQLLLGRDESEIYFNGYASKFRKDGDQFYEFFEARIWGREIVDTLFLAISWDIGREIVTYSLKPMVKQLGLEKETRTFYDASKIRENYLIPEEWEKIKSYCIDDSDDAMSVFDKMSPTIFFFTQSIPKSFQAVNNSATGSQINSFLVRAYLQDGHSIPKASELNTKIDGGISFAIPKLYKNLLKVDLKSAYPSQVLRYKLYDEQKDPKGYFYKMVHYFTYDRFDLQEQFNKTKQIYYYNREQSSKRFINSAYGLCFTNGLNFNSEKTASKITKATRTVINMSLLWSSGKPAYHFIETFYKIVKPKKPLPEREIFDDLLGNNRTYNYIIGPTDTDSISYCKPDMSEFTDEEIKASIKELNSISPEFMLWSNDGYYPRCLALKAKNYVTVKSNGKITIKGSGFKDAKMSLKIKKFKEEIALCFVQDREHEIIKIYERYVLEIMNIQDMKPWSKKTTITAKVLENDRSNEEKVRDAIGDRIVQQGDKIWTYYKEDRSIGLVEDFDGVDYDRKGLLENLYKAIKFFEHVLDITQFPNFKLKKNKARLEELCQK